MEDRLTKWLTPAGAVAFILALTALRVGALIAARTDLGFEEAQYWSWSRELDFGFYSKPPLLALVIRLTTALFGDGEAAVRLASPILHAASALVIMALAWRVNDRRTGALAAILWASAPAASLSATLISTDVALLLAWTCALYALFRLIERPSWGWSLALGLAIGIGLNAKYAMAYFPVCLLVLALSHRADQALLRSRHVWAAMGIAGLLIAPNLAWNAGHRFATLAHLGESGGWQSASLFNPLGALGFLLEQLAVVGPLPLIAVALAAAAALAGRTADATTHRLLALSLPVIAIVTVQAFAAKAYANWAATAYPAAIVLAAALLLQRRWVAPTLAINSVAVLALLIAPAAAPELARTPAGSALRQVLGFSDMARTVGARAASAGAARIVTMRRNDTATLLYYLRGEGYDIRQLQMPKMAPHDHFAMSRPWWFPDEPGTTLIVAPVTYRQHIDTLVGRGLTWDPPFAVSRGVDRSLEMVTGVLSQPQPSRARPQP